MHGNPLNLNPPCLKVIYRTCADVNIFFLSNLGFRQMGFMFCDLRASLK